MEEIFEALRMIHRYHVLDGKAYVGFMLDSRAARPCLAIANGDDKIEFYEDDAISALDGTYDHTFSAGLKRLEELIDEQRNHPAD